MAKFHGRSEKRKRKREFTVRESEPTPWLIISLEGSSVGGVGGYPQAALPQRCCNPRRCGADLLVPLCLSHTFITMPEVLPLRFSPGVLKANHVYGAALKIAEPLWDDFFPNTSEQVL